jgi:hypothetical protein
MQHRNLTLSLLAALALTACGLAETAATTATTGASAAEQVKEGQKLQEQVKTDLDTMQKQAAEARTAAEAAATDSE